MSVLIFDGVPILRDPTLSYNVRTNPGIASLDGQFARGGWQAQDPKPFRNRYQIQRDALRLFRDVLVSEETGGFVTYRCIFLYSNAAITALNVWQGDSAGGNVQPGSGITVAMGLDPAAVNVKGAVITTETAAPAGVAFSVPTSGAPLTMGTFAAYQSRALWFRRTVPNPQTPYQSDFFEFAYQADAATAQAQAIWWNVLAGVKFSIISPPASDMVGRVVTEQRGCVFTVNVVDAATGLTATDPASSTVWVEITGSTPGTGTAVQAGASPVWGTSQPYLTQTLVDQAVKTATGVYRYEFHPPGPGSYQLVFDIGEDTFRTNVIVSAVG